MRTLLLLLFAICIQPCLINICFAQETFSEINVKLNSVEDQTKQSYVLIDSASSGLKIVLADYKNVYVYEIDSTGKILAEQKGEKPNINHNTLLGATASSNTVSVYLSNSSKTSFSCLTFNKSEAKGRKLSFNSNEQFMQAFKYRSDFYVITLKKNTSVMTIYKIDVVENLTSNQIDLSRFRFANSSKYTLYKVLSDSLNMGSTLKVSRIQTDIPNTFEDVKDGAKLYLENGMAIITLDHSTQNTISITINMEDYSYKLRSYQQPYTSCEDGSESRSNSFLHKNHLYQLKFCNNEIHFQVYDTSKREPSAKHLITKNNFDIFRNTYLSREAMGKEEIGFHHIILSAPQSSWIQQKQLLRILPGDYQPFLFLNQMTKTS